MSTVSLEPLSAADWQRLRNLFDQAVALPPETRTRWLDNLGRDDPAMARQLRELLLAEETPAAALDSPAVDILRQPDDPMAAGSPTSMLAPGEQFGSRYQILRLLGVGGMGAVYEAFDRTLGIKVALKIIRPDFASDPLLGAELEARFKRELLLARQISHKNIIRIHDLGEIEGTWYITMALIEGADLARILDGAGRLPQERALHLARQIAEGLAAAHDAGVAHRDLKPSNILVDVHDRAVITDFGIARTLTRTPGAPGEAPDDLAGSFGYMAPEQWAGRPADQRADVYAFGLILSEMLVGPSAAVTSPPLPPRHRDPTVPRRVDAVIARCLRANPNERYPSGAALAAALRGLDPLTAIEGRGGRGAPACPPSPGGGRPLRALACSSLALWPSSRCRAAPRPSNRTPLNRIPWCS